MTTAAKKPKLSTFTDGHLRRYLDRIDGNATTDYAAQSRGSLLKLIRALIGGGASNPPPANPGGTPNNAPKTETIIPDWAKRLPTNANNAARQMGMNAGKVAMPGGVGGAVWIPRVGTDKNPTFNIKPATYGMNPNYGEATFFQEGMNGGVAPIAAFKSLGVPKNWNPGIPVNPADPGADPGNGNNGGNGGQGSDPGTAPGHGPPGTDINARALAKLFLG